MGWDGNYSWRTIEDPVNERVNELKAHDRYVKHALVGNNLWLVMFSPKTGQKFIAIDRIEKHDGCYRRKPMSEEMEPYYYDCPLSLLKLADDPIYGEAVKWRSRVVAYHEAKKERKSILSKLAVGSIVTLTARCKVNKLEITSIKPLIGKSNGVKYRLAKKLISAIE